MYSRKIQLLVNDFWVYTFENPAYIEGAKYLYRSNIGEECKRAFESIKVDQCSLQTYYSRVHCQTYTFNYLVVICMQTTTFIPFQKDCFYCYLAPQSKKIFSVKSLYAIIRRAALTLEYVTFWG